MVDCRATVREHEPARCFSSVHEMVSWNVAILRLTTYKASSRAMQTLPHAPAPLPASKPLEALPAGTTAGSDGMDSVMGVGIGLEVLLYMHSGRPSSKFSLNAHAYWLL